MKRKNGGFSLIEVLVAITVLALIVGPLLHSFVTAVRTNGNARSKERATTVAQNLMEQEVVALSPGGLVPENGWIPMESQETAAALVYEKELTDLALDGKRFDARIRLDASGYPEENGQPLVDIYNMDMRQDACYVEPEEPLKVQNTDSTAAQEFFDSIQREDPESIITLEEIQEQMIRTFTLDIEQTGNAKGASNVQVRFSWRYELSELLLPPEERSITLIQQEKIFDNVDGGKDLRNIYLFYRPQYSSVPGSYTDVFVINNKKEVPVTIYLVHQKSSQVSQVQEKRYCAMVQMNEWEPGQGPLPEGIPGGEWQDDPEFQAAASIRSNLGLPQPDGTELSRIYLEYHRFNRFCEGDIGAGRNQKLTNYAGLTNESARNHVFSVTIEVFSQDGEGAFQEKQKLYTLRGTKED